MDNETQDHNQLAWLAFDGNGGYDREGTKQLYWRFNSVDRWQHYKTHPQRQPDYPIPGTVTKPSGGFSTAQFLLARGWKYVQPQGSTDANP